MHILLLILLLAGAAASAKSREVIVSRAPVPIDGGLNDHEVALTFDDGPDAVITPKVLDVLKKHDMKAVFFLEGDHAEKNPALVKRMLREGHSIGSHSWDHSDLGKMPLNEAMDNLRRGHKAVEAAAGTRTHFFRFPNISSTPALFKGLDEEHLLAFDTNIVTEDWLPMTAKELLAKSLRVLEEKKRGIVLFHDVQAHTGEMLDEFLSELSKRGYTTAVFRSK
jgi:peptidoglycan/xylan/chitin deacetylase (PgdA/CDA1 family)